MSGNCCGSEQRGLKLELGLSKGEEHWDMRRTALEWDGDGKSDQGGFKKE